LLCPCAWLFALLLALLPLAGMAAPPTLMLDDSRPYLEAWDAVTVLHDHDGTLVADALLRAPERFAMPQGAHATLGAQDGASWVRVPVMVAAGSDGAWVLKVDFGLLSHVELYLARDGRIIDRRSAGSGAARGVLGGPVPAFILHLEPGVRYDLLLRVETVSVKILPISFEKPSVFHESAMNEQLLQGMLTGLSLCLLLYSLAHWVNLRDNLFGKYALLVGGLTLYNLSWFGYGRQYLWGGSGWATLHMPAIVTLLTACAGYLFVEQALARPGAYRIFSRLMKGGALLCVAGALAWSFDLLDMKQMVVIISTLGVLPMLLGLPGAFRRARNKDRVGICFLVGWSVSAACTALAGQICTGVLEANYWTLHLLQFGATFDMLVFMRILVLRASDIREAMLRAEAATRMKSAFLANMSHEIRTPMNAIIGMSRLALNAHPDPKLRAYLGKILGAGEHLLGIINDILDFSKIEAGRMTLERVAFDLDAVLDRMAAVTAVKADAKGIALVFEVAPEVPARLVGDPLRLGQVLINLAGNAVKFTDQGRIVVAVEALDHRAGEVLLRFSVSDTGIGMDAAQLATLFQSFTQADGSVSRKYGGTGLGLSISKQLVGLMGGSIAAASDPGVGSRFSFTVRLGAGAAAMDAAAAATTATAAPARPAARDLARLEGARVLLVDDNANNREVALAFLAEAQLWVDVAAGGREAVDMVLAEDYDLVLMDVQMHELDGLSATRQIRALPRLAALPIVAMTAHAMAGDREKSLAAGMNDHLVKPIDPDLLHAALLRWIPARPAHAPAPAAAGPAPEAHGGGVPASTPPLPPLPGIDWDRALAAAGGRPARLQLRIDGFLREYAGAPARLRAALADGDDEPLADLAHNLKAGAAYIGAAPLAAAAAALDLALRDGRRAQLARLVPELSLSLETVLAGLARIVPPPSPAGRLAGAGESAPGPAALAARLDEFLAAEDARAEDALEALQAALAGTRLAPRAAALIDLLRRAVREIDYAAARAHLAMLAPSLEHGMASQA
jgi:signal transduction histidine kinase/HPt (histidine-containing phosphotransfer) domain-containing protein/ActR/RegA family two-component response regulator